MAPAISIVALTRIRRDVKHELFWKVKKAMELSAWKEYVRSGKIFIKTDFGYEKVVPGMCTSPWVLESVLKVIREAMPHANITIGDGGIYTDIMEAYRRWGIIRIAKEQNVQLVDLSRQKMIPAADPYDKTGKSKKRLLVPACVFEADAVVNVPIIRKDAGLGVRASLGNVVSCLPAQRNLKGGVARKICTANLIIKSDFVVADATVCMADDDTLFGRPSIRNTIIAGNDCVAVDTVACNVLGLSHDRLRYLKLCEKDGIGSTKFVHKGMTVSKDSLFLGKNGPKYLASSLPQRLVLMYGSWFWYKFKGRHYAHDIVKKNALYGEEFGRK
jgi:uncharacterized protein (DUF362 family)